MHAPFNRLMAQRRGEANDVWLACMLASQWVGMGQMPAELGLSAAGFSAMLEHHFPNAAWSPRASEPPHWDARLVEERDVLIELLASHRAQQHESEHWMAVIVATGCMSNNHLWQDLGLWSRTDLTNLLKHNFPTLANRNDRDMKWKKFLYKQLCEQEGIYLCRAPSCAVCVEYHYCFGPEYE